MDAPSACQQPARPRLGSGSQQEHSRSQLPRLLGNPSRHSSVSRQKGARTGAKSIQTATQKGAISMLQEFVQCSQTFHAPSNYSVLQWDFKHQMADAATLEFRAIVAFLLDGVPHHVAGTWQPKKKDAQRDAAERALSLFVGKWSTVQEGQNSTAQGNATGHVGEEALLTECCQTLNVCCGVPPCWTVEWEGDSARAAIEMTLLGVPHHFAGAAQSTEAAARKDAARRVLWYLQRPGFQHIYEPDPGAAAIVTMKIPPPPATWAQDSVEEGALEVAERKTAIMRVQNRLQQRFSQELRPGLSVWAWTYEMDPKDEDWPVLCRASVNIPVIGKTFTGEWVRGQRDAQLDTIQQVTCLLDKLDSSP